MRKKYLLALMLLFSVGLIMASEHTIKFTSDLNAAKNQAGREGKLYIVEFVTDRCYPCKMMDEITFTDKHVVGYIQQNYIPVKVNVESFDGFVWKEKYNIRVVPTVMVFNSKGETVAKYEESMGSRRMYNILNEHNRPSNRTASESYVRPAPEIPPPSPSIAEVSRPAPPPPTTTTTTPSYIPAPPTPRIENEIGNASGLFEFKVKRANRFGYGVQVGVYAQYGNVLRAVERLEQQFNRQILVNINTLNGQVVYKVIAGGFASYGNANDFKRQISTSYTDYFVVDLAQI